MSRVPYKRPPGTWVCGDVCYNVCFAEESIDQQYLRCSLRHLAVASHPMLNTDAAFEVLRKKGLAAATKKAGRHAAEGLVGLVHQGNRVAIAEVG